LYFEQDTFIILILGFRYLALKKPAFIYLIFITFGTILVSGWMDLGSASAIWIKITNPLAGQKVGIGELQIKGASSDNATSNCQVYVDWNNQKPYQRAIPTGTGGTDDFSTWAFIYNSSYHLIKEGTNDLTSKMTCAGSPLNPLTMNKWYSINVTGVGSGQSNTVQLPLPTGPSEENKNKNPLLQASNQSDLANSPIIINMDLGHNPIAPGTKQTLLVEAVDPSTGTKIKDAQIQVSVSDQSGNIIKQFDTSDGDLSRSFKVGESLSGNLTVTANVQSGGGSATKSISFNIQ
jgi:hypothetical protein